MTYTSEPPIPAILMASIIDGAKEVSLTLVRTHLRDEGSLLIERLYDPRTVDIVVNGSWRIRDRGAARVLSIEADDPGYEGDYLALKDRLCAEALRQGKRFGFEAYERNGDGA